MNKNKKINDHGKVKVGDVNEEVFTTDANGKKIPQIRDITNSNKIIRTAELIPSMKEITKNDVDEFVKDFKQKHDIKVETKQKKENSKKDKDEDNTQTDEGK